MHINSVQCYNTPASVSVPQFKAYNIVSVKQSAFENPKDMSKCLKTFKKKLNKFTGDMDGILGVLFQAKKSKAICLMENQSYRYAIDAMKKYNISSDSLQKMKLPIADVIKPGYHSFLVFTKDDKFEVARIMVETLIKVINGNQTKRSQEDMLARVFREAIESLNDERTRKEKRAEENAYALVNAGVDIDRNIQERIGEPAHTFVLDSLDLSKIAKELDY